MGRQHLKKGQASSIRRIVLVLFVLAGLIEGGLSGRLLTQNAKNLPQTAEKKSVGFPCEIYISKIDLKAKIIPAGTNSQGEMETSADPAKVAWFRHGPKLGEKGSLVLAGHLDSKTGPAVFFKLDVLEKGDEITIWDERGTQYVYAVSRKKIYEEDRFPTNEVFGANDKERLNLITCKGRFNPNTQRYDQRVVVFAERKS